jgi:hypothetical protein
VLDVLFLKKTENKLAQDPSSQPDPLPFTTRLRLSGSRRRLKVTLRQMGVMDQ